MVENQKVGAGMTSFHGYPLVTVRGGSLSSIIRSGGRFVKRLFGLLPNIGRAIPDVVNALGTIGNTGSDLYRSWKGSAPPVPEVLRSDQGADTPVGSGLYRKRGRYV